MFTKVGLKYVQFHGTASPFSATSREKRDLMNEEEVLFTTLKHLEVD